MTIELTKDQQHVFDAENGTPTVIDPRTQDTYVLVRTDVYNRFRALIDDDFNAEDAFRALIESAAAAGWDDPAMDVYNELDPRKSRRIGQLCAASMKQVNDCLKASLDIP